MSKDLISSPASTGGAGTNFEQHVNAYWLALLLVRGIPPILRDCAVEEVHLQTSHLGWHTDDALICCQDGSGKRRKLACQVKRSFSVSAKDPECKKAVQGFWRDFNNPQEFSPDRDRFALVTQLGTQTLLKHFSNLLICARASLDEADFENRLNASGFLHKRSVQYCDEIRKIIGETERRDVSRGEVWPFLRVLCVLNWDLATASGQDEATIKSLLAYTAGKPAEAGVADITWNILLREAGEGMSEARSFRYQSLPEQLRQSHSQVGDAEQDALRALREHSAPILDGICSTIGEVHLGRDHLVQQVIEHLEANQVVLVAGVAGSGKSVVAKNVFDTLQRADYFAFCFRGEEFAHAHLDETLQTIQVPTTAAKLGAILAGQERKILLVESVERLLEKSTRDAFNDLLTLMAKNKSWRLLLTCRDYSTDLVRSAFLQPARVSNFVVTIPLLANEDLDKVQAAHPSLVYPLGNNALRQVLRNPYFLDKALGIKWSKERPLPQSEREFRKLVWGDIVRVDHRRAKGMPSRREQAFEQVALRRARALTMYVACDDFEREVIQALENDSLIVRSQESNMHLAPAHDVMEDWAILHWIEKQYLNSERSFRAISAEIGAHPAVRRTYRKWVTELVEAESETAEEVFQAALSESETPSHFRDDTLVSLLRSRSSSEFLERYAAELMADDGKLLLRVAHLLRVACVGPAEWLETTDLQLSILSVPDGQAWASVLKLVQRILSNLVQEHALLLLGLIEDWARGVTVQNPYPEGSEAVAAIAYRLLPEFEGYRSEDQLKKTLQVIARIPNADRGRFAELLQGNREESGSASDELRTLIFGDMVGMPAARDMPELVVSTAKDFLLCTEEDLATELIDPSAFNLEPHFGIRGLVRRYTSSSVSAFRGSFLPLLRHHSQKGLDLIVDILNHSADWYARLGVRRHSLEPLEEETLISSDGISITQWGNARLWCLHRGTAVGPDILMCILMALEYWLLEQAEEDPDRLDENLLYILTHSHSCALTAVVASVATAYPQLAGDSLLMLLQSRRYLQYDKVRHKKEQESPYATQGYFPGLRPNDKIFSEERKKANALPHRQEHLEQAILKLQWGPRATQLAPRIHAILDFHYQSGPPQGERTDEDKIWLRSLYCMDLRMFKVERDLSSLPVPFAELNSHEEDGLYVIPDFERFDPEVKELMSQSTVTLRDIEERASLFNWGVDQFEKKLGFVSKSSQWKSKLQEARHFIVNSDLSEDYFQLRDSKGFIAAVCVRDHWEHMSRDEQAWCVDTICLEVMRAESHWNEIASVQLNRLSADRPCAHILPCLLGKPLSEAQRKEVYQVLVVALTHANFEVRNYASSGIGDFLWTIERDMALKCVNALATEAILVQRHHDRNRRSVFPRRWDFFMSCERAAKTVRKQFHKLETVVENPLSEFDPTRKFERRAYKDILTILGMATDEPVATEQFGLLSKTLVRWWNSDRSVRQDRDYKLESELLLLIPGFLFQTSSAAASHVIEPLLDSVDNFPREIHWLVHKFIEIEDRQPNTERFWWLWGQFADRVRVARWLAELDEERSTGKEMMSAMFLGVDWKASIRHWRSLEGYERHLHCFFEDLPLSSAVVADYVRFLYNVGEGSFPEAFVNLQKKISKVSPIAILLKGSTIFHLEVLLQRYVYSRPLELKRQRDIREAVLFLLDLLVENGSSSAFKMRDDFVTPVQLA